MAFIPQSFVEDLLSRIDIIDVINSRIPLRKSGRNYMACCPFHQEKSPSFSVVPDKQFFNCFGCGMAGSAIKFVMAFDGIDFVASVEKLAAMVGLEVPRDKSVQDADTNNYKLYYDVLNWVTASYQDNLNKNKTALDYLHNRSLDPDISKFFLLGYAQDGWDNLTKILINKNIDNPRAVLEKLGLWIKADETKAYDRFRNRLMFPIRDQKGRVIAFGGRVLDDSKPKYLNSPETVLFHKSAELYGLYETLELNAKNKTKISKFVIVEGYIDVITLFQHGINYAVATLGTASSYRHLAKLFKYCEEVIYCFDGDEAGRTAAWRALENCLPALYDGRKIRFLFLPSEHDPDSYIKKYGKQEFEQQLHNAVSLTDYLFKHQEELLDSNGLTTIENKVQFVNLCKPLLNKVPMGTYRAIIESELAKRCNLNELSLSKILANAHDSSDFRQSIDNNADNRFPVQKIKTGRHSTQLSIWRKASLLLIHNPEFIEFISQEFVEAVFQNTNNQDLLIFREIYKLFKQVKTIPEVIDLLAKDSTNNNIKNIIIDYLATEPMISDTLAETEFKDLLKYTFKEQLQSEMEYLKQKVASAGMGNLTPVEKARLQALLLESSR